MATTTYGSPYVTSTDLVANWPAASLTVANSIDQAGYYIGRGINAQTASYTGVLTDAGKTVTLTVGTANVFNIPANSSVAYVVGTRINILNLGAGACTVTALAGVTVNGTITALVTNKAASIVKTATNTWSYIPFSSGADAAVVTSTTGSPTITTDGTATVYKFTGDGTMVIGTAGQITVQSVGAGGGAGRDYGGGGGGGGNTATTSSAGLAVNVPTGTLTVKIGAGGAGMGAANGTAGGMSGIGPVIATGGGSGAGRTTGSVVCAAVDTTSSAGGGYYGSTAGGVSYFVGLGFAGGTGNGSLGGGGGGGGSAVGANAVGAVGGAGGAGASCTISGASVQTSGGGGGSTGSAGGAGGGGASTAGTGVAGTVNTGGGGGAAGASGNGAAGGSGVVYVRVG